MENFLIELNYLHVLLEKTYLRNDINNTKNQRINMILRDLSILTTQQYYKF